jgi:hypothetical protein
MRDLRTVTLLMVCATSVSAATLSVQPPLLSVNAGTSFTLDVNATGVVDLYAFQFDISFDPAVLSATSIAEGGYFMANGVAFAPGTIDNVAGTISLIADTLSGPGPGFTGSTLLATATFTAIGAGASNVSPTSLILLDSGLNNIDVNTSPATVSVSRTTVTPEPGSLGLLTAGLCIGGMSFRKHRRGRQIKFGSA